MRKKEGYLKREKDAERNQDRIRIEEGMKITERVRKRKLNMRADEGRLLRRASAVRRVLIY